MMSLNFLVLFVSPWRRKNQSKIFWEKVIKISDLHSHTKGKEKLSFRESGLLMLFFRMRFVLLFSALHVCTKRNEREMRFKCQSKCDNSRNVISRNRKM